MNPRGSIVLPSRPIELGGGAVATGRKPGIIVYVKAGSGRLMRKFERFLIQHGIHTREVQDNALECLGTLESLDFLTEHPAVADWHYVLNVKPPHVAGGSGAISPNAEKLIRRSKMRRSDREALEETERRARLSHEKREKLELAELMERERILA